jgi:response regulator RpfG family c-di-GMP phosphodiesterase
MMTVEKNISLTIQIEQNRGGGFRPEAGGIYNAPCANQDNLLIQKFMMNDRMQAPPEKKIMDNDDLSFLGFVREYYPDIIRIFLSGQGSLKKAIEPINYPDVFKDLTTIWNSSELKGKISNAFGPFRVSAKDWTLHFLTQSQTEELSVINENLKDLIERPDHQVQEFVRDGIILLAAVAEAREDTSGGHVFRIRRLTQEIAEGLGLSSDEVKEISFSSMMHDIGKIQIPDNILLKPGPLDDEERGIMQCHCRTGEEMLGEKSLYMTARQIARSHHEHWDGTGYPDGLKGNLIPLAARVTAIADAFDALTNERCYKKTWPARMAVYEMKALCGKQFDPEILNVFLRLQSAGMKAAVGQD